MLSQLVRVHMNKLFLLILAVAVTSGCGGRPTLPTVNVEENLVKSELARDTSGSVSGSALTELANGDSSFAFDLYHAISQKGSNLFLSPYSISTALAMTYAGARGETAQQMAATLHFSLPTESLHQAFNRLDLQLSSQDPNNFQLNVANSLWAQRGFPLQPSFLDVLARNYGAGVRLIDFVDTAKREQAREVINNWVQDQTHGKIKDIIDKDSLNELTRLVLANAIYFKGEWKNPFYPVQPRDFTNLSGERLSVPTMSRRANFPYAEAAGYQAVELPYKGDRIGMIILLPAAGQLATFEQSLDIDRLQTTLAGLHEQDILVSLPKFGFESRTSLKQTLSTMGMPDAFDTAKADLTGMYDQAKNSQRLFISDVLHDAWVKVDERGTEAAGATDVIVGIVSMPKEVRIDRPFVFVIYDHQTASILFIGREVDPSR